MYHYHYSNHRGHEALCTQIQSVYWWSRLSRDCEEFVAACPVCGPVRSGGVQKVADGEVSTPATPFATIHVDHKGPLPRQADSKFAHILVVVCALTRYALFIPVKTTTADVRD